MEQSEIVVSMVSDSKALDDITTRNDGLLHGAEANKVHIDMSTVSPLATTKLERLYQAKHAAFLHAPVLGSVPQAGDGSLLIFVGGDPATAGRCETVLKTLGWRIWYFDDITKAGNLKLACNLFIASMIPALAEGLVFSQRAGVLSSTVLEVLKESALGAPMYQTKGEAIGRRNFTPRFLLAHMLKDRAHWAFHFPLSRRFASFTGMPAHTVSRRKTTRR